MGGQRSPKDLVRDAVALLSVDDGAISGPGRLRHTHAVWLLAQQAPIGAIAGRLRHANPVLTMRMCQFGATLVHESQLTTRRSPRARTRTFGVPGMRRIRSIRTGRPLGLATSRAYWRVLFGAVPGSSSHSTASRDLSPTTTRSMRKLWTSRWGSTV
jgi:hypothetical protein